MEIRIQKLSQGETNVINLALKTESSAIHLYIVITQGQALEMTFWQIS